MKTCTKCKKIQELNRFNKDKNNKDGLTAHCKDCLALKFAKWRARNKETHNAKSREWHTKNKELCRARALQWNKEHRTLVNARYTARKKHIRLATPKWADKSTLIDFYKNRPIGHHVDHIVPLQGENVCGLHVLWNLQYLPAAENIAKGNRF